MYLQYFQLLQKASKLWLSGMFVMKNQKILIELHFIFYVTQRYAALQAKTKPEKNQIQLPKTAYCCAAFYWSTITLLDSYSLLKFMLMMIFIETL